MAEKGLNTKSSEFSEKLVEYINSSDYTVYKLSQITGLGRTAIQHTMSGKLLPAQDFVEKLSLALPITTNQRSELIELYRREKIGSKAYYNRIHVKEMIEQLPNYCIADSAPKNKTIPAPVQCDTVVRGIVNVNNALRNIIINENNEENPLLTTTLPYENKMFFDMLKALDLSDKSIKLKHYIKTYDETDPITMLEEALKLSMNKGIIYKMYVSCEQNRPESYSSAFPFYLLSSRYIVTISADFNAAYISDNKDLHSIFMQHTADIEQKSVPTLDTYDEFQMFDILFGNGQDYSESIEFQPCLSSYINIDNVMSHMKYFEGRSELIDKFKSRFFYEDGTVMALLNKCYFSLDGLKSFTENGIIVTTIGRMVPTPLTIEERIYLLEKLRDDTEKKVMIDPIRLTIPENMQLFIREDKSIVISFCMSDSPFCCVVHSVELYEIFNDFVDSLEQDKLVVSEAEMVQAVDDCISALKNKLAQN